MTDCGARRNALEGTSWRKHRTPRTTIRPTNTFDQPCLNARMDRVRRLFGVLVTSMCESRDRSTFLAMQFNARIALMSPAAEPSLSPSAPSAPTSCFRVVQGARFDASAVGGAEKTPENAPRRLAECPTCPTRPRTGPATPSKATPDTRPGGTGARRAPRPAGTATGPTWTAEPARASRATRTPSPASACGV